jgi:selenocysteine lyase/cysteine desulfurase
MEPAYLAAASLAEPPLDFIARLDNMALPATAGRFELGNFNLPAIQGLGGAIDFINEVGIEKIQRHCFDLGDHLIEGLDRLNVGLVGPRDRQHRAPHIYVVTLPAADWLDYLTQSGIRVSPERDGIRVSLGMFNNTADIDRLIEVAARICDLIRSSSDKSNSIPLFVASAMPPLIVNSASSNCPVLRSRCPS